VAKEGESRLDTLSFDQFVGHLRSALHYLYDPDQLRRNALVPLFGVGRDSDAAAALQRLLTAAIEALQPAADEPPQSRAWRIYDALVYRYVRRFDRETVADQLGISGRQLRREQRAALETLASRLWQRYGLESQTAQPLDFAHATLTGQEPGLAPLRPTFGGRPSTDWLADLPPEKPAALAQTIRGVLDLTRPLASQWRVQVTCESLEELGDLAAPQVTLRYALLSLLGVIIPRAQGNRVTLSAQPASGSVTLTVDTMNLKDAQLSERERVSLEMARQLTDLAGGQLDLDFTRDGGAARLTLPLLARIPVLVVDDNADTLHLFSRYVTGTRFCLTSTHRPEEALRLAVELAPRIIVLDVMMPGIDGWEVLTRLRAHPTMADTALIVCTVLPQEELALALGADGFLQKPVTREAFLAVLERHSEVT